MNTRKIWNGNSFSISDIISELQYSSTYVHAELSGHSVDETKGNSKLFVTVISDYSGHVISDVSDYSEHVIVRTKDYSLYFVTSVSEYSQHLGSETTDYNRPIESTINILTETSITPTLNHASAIASSINQYTADTLVPLQPNSDAKDLDSSTNVQTSADSQFSDISKMMDRKSSQNFIREDSSFSSINSYQINSGYVHMLETEYSILPSPSAWKPETSVMELKELERQGSFPTDGSSVISQSFSRSHYDGQSVTPRIFSSSWSEASGDALYGTDIISTPISKTKSYIVSNTVYVPSSASHQTQYTHIPAFRGYKPDTVQLTDGYWNNIFLPQGKNTCRCRCRVLLGDAVLSEQMKDDVRRLSLNPTNLSQQRRKKISMPDSRVSAQSIGYVGVFTLVLVFGPHVMSDVFSVVRYVLVQTLSK